MILFDFQNCMVMRRASDLQAVKAQRGALFKVINKAGALREVRYMFCALAISNTQVSAVFRLSPIVPLLCVASGNWENLSIGQKMPPPRMAASKTRKYLQQTASKTNYRSLRCYST